MGIGTQINRRREQSTEIGPHIYISSYSTKVARQFNEEKAVFSINGVQNWLYVQRGRRGKNLNLYLALCTNIKSKQIGS